MCNNLLAITIGINLTAPINPKPCSICRHDSHLFLARAAVNPIGRYQALSLLLCFAGS